MKITKIEKKSGTRYTVDVDGEYFYIFDIEILTRNQIRVGTEVDEKLLKKLRCQAEVRKAKERAFHLLSYRDHSEQELFDKLCKTTSPKIAAFTVAKMKELHLIDNEQYAQKLARYFLTEKCWGFRKCIFEMKRKGIESDLAEEALTACGIDPLEQIAKWIEQKYIRRLGDFKGNQKVIQALIRQGFEYDDIKTVVNEYLTAEAIEDF